MSSYNFSIANDTANAALVAGKLAGEITNSSISAALDSVSANGDAITIAFSSSLSAEEQTTLAAVLSAHDGEPIPESLEPQLVDLVTKTPSGKPLVASAKPDGESKTYISHNFCTDGSSWELDSVVLGLGDLSIYKAEVQFTMDVMDSFNSNANYQLRMDVYAGGFPVPGQERIFNTIFDVFDLGNAHYTMQAPNTTTMGGGLTTVVFDYTDTITMIAAYGMKIVFSSLGGAVLPGTHCSVSMVAGPKQV
jgi:hypothetical protein